MNYVELCKMHLKLNYFECMHDVIYEAESALCNINKHHLQLKRILNQASTIDKCYLGHKLHEFRI